VIFVYIRSDGVATGVLAWNYGFDFGYFTPCENFFLGFQSRIEYTFRHSSSVASEQNVPLAIVIMQVEGPKNR